MATLTASTHLVIPSLIGRGLTDDVARDKLAEARRVGWATAQVHGSGVLSVTYAGKNKFTIGEARP